MADVKISALPAAGSSAGADELPANQAGTTRKVTTTQMATAIFALKTTANLTENTNLYYTQARFDTAFAAKLAADLTLSGQLKLSDGVAGTPSIVFSSEPGLDTGFRYNGTAGTWSFTSQGVDDVILLKSGGDLAITGNFSAANFPQSGTNNTLAYFNGSGDLSNWSEATRDTTSGGINFNLQEQPNNVSGGFQGHQWTLSLDPLQNSPDDSWNMHNLTINLDPNSTGFTLGTSGQCATVLNGGFTHSGTSNVGALNYLNFNSNLGNGVDPITIKALSGGFVGSGFAANVTIDGPVQGWTVSNSFNAASIGTSNFSILSFADNSSVNIPVNGYEAMNISINLAGVTNNHNAVGFNFHPTIATLTGNASTFGVVVSPSITTMSATGGFTGISLNPTITTSHGNFTGMNIQPSIVGGDANVTLLNLDMSSVTTSGTKKLLSLSSGDVELNNGTYKSSASKTINDTDYFFAGFNSASMTAVVPNATAITGAQIVLNQLNGNFTLGDATSSIDNGPVGIGQANVGFIGNITGDGSATEISMLLAGYSAAAGAGSVTRVNVIKSIAFPSTGVTVTDHVGVFIDIPGGAVATNQWGIRVESALLENYLPTLAVGTATKKVSTGIVLDVFGNIESSADMYALKFGSKDLPSATSSVLYASGTVLNGSADSGGVTFRTGDSIDGSLTGTFVSGGITFYTGATDTTKSGDITMSTGNSDTGTAGNIDIASGVGNGSQTGLIRFFSDADNVRISSSPTGAVPTAIASVQYVQDNRWMASSSAPATAASAGTAGQIAYDSSFFYVCTATNTWKRIAIITF